MIASFTVHGTLQRSLLPQETATKKKYLGTRGDFWCKKTSGVELTLCIGNISHIGRLHAIFHLPGHLIYAWPTTSIMSITFQILQELYVFFEYNIALQENLFSMKQTLQEYSHALLCLLEKVIMDERLKVAASWWWPTSKETVSKVPAVDCCPASQRHMSSIDSVLSMQNNQSTWKLRDTMSSLS